MSSSVELFTLSRSTSADSLAAELTVAERSSIWEVRDSLIQRIGEKVAIITSYKDSVETKHYKFHKIQVWDGKGFNGDLEDYCKGSTAAVDDVISKVKDMSIAQGYPTFYFSEIAWDELSED